MSANDSRFEDGNFLTTRWSRVVLAADAGGAADAQDALADLCRDCWRPLYYFARRKGLSPDDAQDATQGFFLHMLDGGMLGRADAQRGRFRTFLLAGMQHFLTSEYRRQTALKRGGGAKFIEMDALDAESRFALEPANPVSPETEFERTWAFTLIERVFGRLAAEYAQAGRLRIFETLQPFIAAQSARPGYEAAAATLGVTANAVGVAVHRMRQRYGELLREEIRHTVASQEEVDGEIAHLMEVVARG